MPSNDRLASDLRWACRTVARRPLFSLLATGTLAVAIGAAMTALGLATAVLWRPLPFDDAERVVFVWENNPTDAEALRPQRVTGGRYAAWRDHHRSLHSLALFGSAGFSLEGPDGRAAVRGVRVSASYFDTLGATPLLGRTFTPADEIPGQHFVVVLAPDFWQQRFGGRPDVVGTEIRLSGQPYTIVGVMPPHVYPAWPVNPATVTLTPSSRQLWVPIARSPEIDGNARSHVYGVIGRLGTDVTIEQATADLAGLASASPDPHGVHLTPLRTQLTGDARQPLLIVLASAAAVLLVACANLAALYLASFERRRSELATRASLGASARELVRLLAFEALLVAGAGGAAGIALARAALTWLPSALPPTVPFVTAPALDLRLALISAAAALLAGFLLAAWPIARLLRQGPAPRGLPERARSRAYGALVAAQLAITVALVSAAAWLGQSLWSVQSRDPGFVVDEVVVVDVSVPAGPEVTAADIVAAEDRVRAAVDAQPGVRGAALAYDHPLEANWTDSYVLTGHETRPDETASAQLRIVSPSYFEALDVALLDGRLFTDREGLDAGGVAIVNESFARAHEGIVLGRALRSQAARRTWGADVPDTFTLLGIVEDERFRGLEEPTEAAVYLSTRQFPHSGFSLVARTDQPRALAASLRTIVRGAEPRASVETPALLSRILSDQLAPRRLTTDVLGGLAGATLLLAGLGLYGLLAMMVAGQTREVGVRLALGATPSAVARAVIGAGGRYVALGLAAGLVLAFVAARLVSGWLVGVSASDPLTIAAVLSVMALTALTASLLPALRAARVDPVAALRTE